MNKKKTNKKESRIEVKVTFAPQNIKVIDSVEKISAMRRNNKRRKRGTVKCKLVNCRKLALLDSELCAKHFDLIVSSVL